MRATFNTTMRNLFLTINSPLTTIFSDTEPSSESEMDSNTSGDASGEDNSFLDLDAEDRITEMLVILYEQFPDHPLSISGMCS